MKNRNIYFLHWNNNRCFIANPPAKAALIDFLENEDIKGYYGSSPSAEDMQNFQANWKVKIDLAIRAWFNDSKFILHFILATGIFLLSFYFLSYVIRDPLPLVDEIVLSFLLALLGWHRLANQDVQSEKALLKKQELTDYLNRIPFESVEFLKQVELYLEKIGSMSGVEKSDFIREGSVPLFFNSYSQEMMDFRKALEGFLKDQNSRGPGRLTKKKRMSQKEDLSDLIFLFKQLSEYLKNR